MVYKAMKMAANSSLVVALLYRWKGFAEANAKMWRGRKYHSLWDQALADMYPKKTIKKAEAQAKAKSLADMDLGTRQAVRAGGVLDFIRGDPKALKNEVGIVLSRPQSSCSRKLNNSFVVCVVPFSPNLR